ncbi:MAG: hypothetical protein JWN61_2226 [Pseudonocardiales bacterium]|nr:hypothetical protein [Jatrophihabitantaceae bacterium]MCW2604091.1 hypothetical protein [Pseudonocardiales bacterium]
MAAATCALASLLSGCAPDPGAAGSSLGEAQAQARTCQSLLERRTGESVAPIDPGIFLAAMGDPRLASRTTAEVVIRICDGIGRKRAGLPAS